MYMCIHDGAEEKKSTESAAERGIQGKHKEMLFSAEECDNAAKTRRWPSIILPVVHSATCVTSQRSRTSERSSRPSPLTQPQVLTTRGMGDSWLEARL